MRITVTNVFVDDQRAALAFYTEVLGFVTKHDVPMGDGLSWITVVGPEQLDGPELLLEPADHPAVAPFRQALREDGIPWTSFGVTDVHAEHERLTALGVTFVQEPETTGPVTTAVFDDTCGNLVQLAGQATQVPNRDS